MMLDSGRLDPMNKHDFSCDNDALEMGNHLQMCVGWDMNGIVGICAFPPCAKIARSRSFDSLRSPRMTARRGTELLWQVRRGFISPFLFSGPFGERHDTINAGYCEAFHLAARPVYFDRVHRCCWP